MKTNFSMEKELIKLALSIRKAVLPLLNNNQRKIIRRHDGGDPHFTLDEVAEKTVEKVLKSWNIPLAYFSEDRNLVLLNKDPKHILIIDPIDGTRPALANFESCCVSIVVAPYSKHPTFADITHALVLELKSGAYFYADSNAKIKTSPTKLIPVKKEVTVENMFWSTELTAHPIKQIARVCGPLIDNSVVLGAVFVFTSSSYSLTRILTGQLDAHVDVGHRILKDNPQLTEEFRKVGRGKIVTLFPYDISAAAFILIKSGGIVTDAYGNSLAGLGLLTDKSLAEQCSLIAASNKKLHENIMSQLNFGAAH